MQSNYQEVFRITDFSLVWRMRRFRKKTQKHFLFAQVLQMLYKEIINSNESKTLLKHFSIIMSVKLNKEKKNWAATIVEWTTSTNQLHIWKIFHFHIVRCVVCRLFFFFFQFSFTFSVWDSSTFWIKCM